MMTKSILLILLFFVIITGSFISAETKKDHEKEYTFSPTSFWIQAPKSNSSQPANLFRSPPFSIGTSSVSSVTLYISGIGFSKVSVNGKEVLNSDGTSPQLEPGLTAFKYEALCVAYEIKDLINFGISETNIIGVELGFGWMMPLAENMVPRVRAELVVVPATTEPAIATLFTNSNWQTTNGPIVYDNIYNGETYNVSMEIPGWNTPSSSSSSTSLPDKYRSGSPVSWTNASQLDPSDYNPNLRFRKFPGMTIIKQYYPQEFWMADNETLVVDFGIDISGFARLSVAQNQSTSSSSSSSAFDVVQLHYGEILNHYDEGKSQYVYFANLRSAKATDLLILPPPKAGETSSSSSVSYFSYQPTFTYHGFRFVQINVSNSANVDLNFIANNIIALEVHSNLELISDFESSTTIFNEVHARVLGAQQSNQMSYMSDSNNRDERLSWLADSWLTSSANVLNWDIHSFNENLIQLMHADQLADGAIGDVEPFFRFGGRPADPSWGLALPYITNLHYAETTNTNHLAEVYPYSVAWLDLLIGVWQKDGINNIIQRYGDWVPPPPAAKVSNGFASAWAFLTTINELRTASANLNNVTQFLYYTDLLENSLYQQFVDTYFHIENETFDIGGTQQTTYVFPMTLPGVMELASKKSKSGTKLRNNLLKLIEQSDYHFNTGILGLRFLFEQVSRELGRIDVASHMLLQTQYPSYAYEWLNDIETPTTANLWEIWNAPDEGPSMDSRDHHMDSSIDLFLFENVGGFMSARTAATAANAKFTTSSNSFLLKQIQQQHEKYANYKTIVFDASATSYDIPSLRRMKVSRKLVNINKTVAFSWRKEGGNTLCYQFTKKSKNGNAHPLVNLDCGEQGGVISEIDYVAVDGSALQGPNCASLHHKNTGEKNSMEKQLHNDKIKNELQRRCVGNRGCRLRSASSWWNPKIHNKTDSLIIRGRCTGSLKVFMDLEVVSHQQQQQQQHQQQDFEIFVPVFGMHNPSISTSSETLSAKMQNKHIHIDVNPNEMTRHPLFHLISRSKMHHETESPALVRVHGSLPFSFSSSSNHHHHHRHKISILVSEQEGENDNDNHNKNLLLSSLHQKKEETENKYNNLFITSPFSSNKQENTCHGTGQVVIGIDRIQSDYILEKCSFKKNDHFFSISELVQEIETECVGKKNSCFDLLLLFSNKYHQNQQQKCISNILMNQPGVVTLRCGQKSSMFEDFRMD